MNALELHQVSVRYPDQGRPGGLLEAARAVSFSLNRGDIGCLLGQGDRIRAIVKDGQRFK